MAKNINERTGRESIASADENIPINQGHTNSVAFALAKTLTELGASICFGVAGSSNYTVCEALVRLGVRYVSAGHECNALAMADAFARHSGKLTLASVHAGPGLTNAITAIGEAAKARTPLVVLAGDVAVGDVRSNFYIDQDALVKSVGAVPERLHSPGSALDDVIRACEMAICDNRTVVISMPLDILRATAPTTTRREANFYAAPSMPESKQVSDLANRLLSAKRPLILGGRGAVIAGAGPTLALIAEAVGGLLATTARAYGLFSGNPCSVGIMGGFSPPAMARLIKESDLLLAVGASLTHWTTRSGDLIAEGATVVQIDSDPARLGCNGHVDLAVPGDALATAQLLLEEVQRLKPKKTEHAGWRTNEVARTLASNADDLRDFADISTVDYIDPRALCLELEEILPKDRTIANDGGHFQGWPPQYLTVPDAQAWSFAMSFSVTGLGLGTAIGAALGQPERLTVLCAGDGGFTMSLSDLQTAINLKLRLCIVIFNDASYAAEVHEFGPLGYGTSIVEFPVTNFAEIARGFGAAGAVVRTKADLSGLREWIAHGGKGVYLVDARINPRVSAEWFQELMKQKHSH